MKKIIRAVALPDYRVEVIFEGGEQGILDMKPYLDFGIFTRLKNTTAFQQVHVSFDTIEWPCGPDLDPEWLREKVLRQPVG